MAFRVNEHLQVLLFHGWPDNGLPANFKASDEMTKLLFKFLCGILKTGCHVHRVFHLPVNAFHFPGGCFRLLPSLHVYQYLFLSFDQNSWRNNHCSTAQDLQHIMAGSYRCISALAYIRIESEYSI